MTEFLLNLLKKYPEINPDLVGEVKVAIHGSQGLFWIDDFYIPEKMRNQGIGKSLYYYIENQISMSGGKTIKLFAAQYEQKRSNHFWESVGFNYDNDPDDSDNDWYMSKKI
jgi:GNAT superfamily N-acetyltransferase